MILSYDIILENFVRTYNKQRTNRQTENSKPEATLIPVDCRGEWANREQRTENINPNYRDPSNRRWIPGLRGPTHGSSS